MLKKKAFIIAERLKKDGHIVYYAGGCVRDALMGIKPKDIDIVTSAQPRRILSLFHKSDAVGAHFGVILVKEGGIAFDVATFRKDGIYLDGRHPSEVTYSGAEEDACRRDFTINGLFEDPWTGEIIDYVGGLDDMQARVIRAIGNPEERFREDALRLLRAVRFAVVTGFTIEKTTYKAMEEHASLLQQISMERIHQEFLKILTAPRRAQGIDILVKTGLMRFIIPEVYDLIGCEQPPQWHPEGDVYKHTLIMLELLGDKQISEELALATLLHDIGKPPVYALDETGRIRFSGHDTKGAEMTIDILKRLKCSKKQIDAVTEMVKNHMKFMNVQQMRLGRLRLFMGRPTFCEELELHRVDCLSSNGLLDNYEFVQEKMKQFDQEPIIPPPLITGRDLIDMGIRPSPQFKAYLNDVQQRQLEGELTTRDEALIYLQSLATLEH